jgi:hypothetical protein
LAIRSSSGTAFFFPYDLLEYTVYSSIMCIMRRLLRWAGKGTRLNRGIRELHVDTGSG